ncbi:DUF3899 domain-containing protein [Sporosarcina sp. P26b]|uniref:DUF3899 domain-containing protein n=1 Tax=Sporosarcina TaxID=1569 RepID=UPI000A17EF64|nr:MULTISPECIES: DUF3899 domain-containing protein [Sporosarcina]ARK21301.1 hypothetical protein SporoP32a_07025 [Sporosarcina ureae]PIC95473.1 DUF3899 domain-containing protein [Sporosarcina sp. P26b]
MLTLLIAGMTIITWILIGTLGSFSLVEMANMTFLVGLVGLVVYAIVMIIESNFLTIFMSGFKKIKYVAFPQSRSSKRTDDLLNEDHELAEWKTSIQRGFKKAAAAIAFPTLAISLVCLALYY